MRTASLLKTANVISFATHGLLSGEFNSISEPGLILSKGKENNSSDNGYLTFSEIGTLDITADIVILSACNTGGAQTNNSNAFSGLAASFIASGAKKVLASHWNVESIATKYLISLILKSKNKKNSWEEAIRLGISIFYKNFPEYKSPYYWGAFQLFTTTLS